MSNWPTLKSSDITNGLKKAGFQLVRQKGIMQDLNMKMAAQRRYLSIPARISAEDSLEKSYEILK